MRIGQLRDNYRDHLAAEYLQGTTRLTAKDLRDEHICLALLILSYKKKLRFLFSPTETTDFFGKSSTPFDIVGLECEEARLKLIVKGMHSNRIVKRWDKRAKNRLGADFQGFEMEWVET